MANKRHVKLGSIRDVSKFIQKVINEVRRGETGLESAKTQGYLVRVLIESLEKSDLEARIQELERLVLLQRENANHRFRT